MGWLNSARSALNYRLADKEKREAYDEAQLNYNDYLSAHNDNSDRLAASVIMKDQTGDFPDSSTPATADEILAIKNHCKELGIPSSEEPHHSADMAMDSLKALARSEMALKNAGDEIGVSSPLDAANIEGGAASPDGIAGNQFGINQDPRANAVRNAYAAGYANVGAPAGVSAPAVKGTTTPANRTGQTAPTPNESKVTTTYGQQQRFKQQCYLLSKIKSFAKFSTTLHSGYKVDGTDYSRKLPYADNVSNTAISVVGEPFALINKLIGNTNNQALNDLTPAQLSSLVPMLRIYKASKQSDGTELHNEIIFDTHITRNDMSVFESRAARGAGSGLQSMDITFDGSNFFTAKKAIKAKLNMHFDSFNDIIRTRRGPTGNFRYIDLALRTSSRKGVRKDPNRDAFAENYRIKVIAGWAVPDGGLDKEIFNNPDIREAIKNACVILNLVMVTQQFNIDELGRVGFEIEYMAYIDAAFSTKYANVLTNNELMEKYLKRESALRIISKSDCTAAEKSELKKELSQEADKDKRMALKTLLTKLTAEKKIFYHVIPVKALDNFNKLGPWSDDAGTQIKNGENFVQNDVERDILRIIDAYDDSKDLPENLTGLIRRPTSNQEYILPFFFLGDLLNAGLGNISEYTSNANNIASGNDDVDEDFFSFAYSFKKLRILLGDIELIEPKTGAIYATNMADVPISIDYFVEWFMSKVIAKGGEADYPLVNFVKDLTNTLLSTAADSECFGSSGLGKVTANVSYITGIPDQDSVDPATIAAGNGANKRILLDSAQTQKGGPIIKTSDAVERLASESKQAFHYIVFYASRAYPHNRRANYINDTAAGIPHLEIGRGEGLVKNIQFSKAEQKYYKELRFELEGYEGLAQVREPYDATITMFGNMTYFPGSYVYIDPRGLGSMMGSPQDFEGDSGYGSISWQLGLGGYYMVKKVATRISAGVFETTLHATWVARGGMGDPEKAPALMAATSEDCSSPFTDVENLSAPGGTFSPDIIGINVVPGETETGDRLGYVEDSRTGVRRDIYQD